MSSKSEMVSGSSRRPRRESEEIFGGVYGIYEESECLYVGASYDYLKRCWEHQKLLGEGAHFNSELQSRYDSREDEFEYRLLERVDGSRDERTSREAYWMYQTQPVTNIARSPDGFLLSSAIKGRPNWNSGLTKDTDERVAEIGRKISESKKGQTAWNKGRPSHLRGETKESCESVRRQAESLRNRPLVECPKCGQLRKVLKKHLPTCKGVIST